MTKEEARERRLVRSMAGFIENEPQKLARLRVYYKITAVVSWLMLMFTFLVLFQAGSTFGWVIGLGFAAGATLGANIYFHNAIIQWPVLRRFLNVEAIKEAAREERL